jgi:hypothetical protein
VIFTKQTYRVKQDPITTFNYFLSKKYLVKSYGIKEGKVTLTPKDDDEPIYNTDEFRITTETKDFINELFIDKIEIEKHKSIKMRMTYGNVVNKLKTEDENKESEDMTFRILPKDFSYTARFYKAKSIVVVVETLEINHGSFLKKLLLKIYGFSEVFFLLKSKIVVTNEIESLKNT